MLPLCPLLGAPGAGKQREGMAEYQQQVSILGGGFGGAHCAACGILVPHPGIEPTPPAVEVQSLNRWTAREVPQVSISKTN